MDNDDILLEELASTYEQLNIFYNWYERVFSGVTSKSKIRDALLNVTRATNSLSAMMTSLGRGQKLSVISSWSSSPEIEKAVLSAITDQIAEIEGRLSADSRVALSVDFENETLYLLIIPWKIGHVLKGVFAFSRKSSPFKTSEQILLRNSAIQLGILMDSSILSSSLDKNNHELATLLTSNITEFDRIFGLLRHKGNNNCLLSMVPLPEEASIHTVLSENWEILDSSNLEFVGKSVADSFQDGICQVVKNREEYQDSLPDGRQLRVTPVEIDNMHVGSVIVITSKNTKPSLPSKLNTIGIRHIRNYYSQIKAIESMSKIYTSHLISVSRLVDTMHPTLSKRMSNMNMVLTQLSQAMKLSSEDTKTLMLSAKLIDVSLVYLDYGTLERYLVHGTSTLNSGILKEVHDHPLMSAELLKHLPELSECAEIVATHHERWDGLGYPNGLKGEEIPQLSRMLHMAQSLSYRTENYFTNAMDMLRIDTEVDWLVRQAGRAFDPRVVEALFRSSDIEIQGVLVEKVQALG